MENQTYYRFTEEGLLQLNKRGKWYTQDCPNQPILPEQAQIIRCGLWCPRLKEAEYLPHGVSCDGLDIEVHTLHTCKHDYLNHVEVKKEPKPEDNQPDLPLE